MPGDELLEVPVRRRLALQPEHGGVVEWRPRLASAEHHGEREAGHPRLACAVGLSAVTDHAGRKCALIESCAVAPSAEPVRTPPSEEMVIELMAPVALSNWTGWSRALGR
jgi:hypothetical protein